VSGVLQYLIHWDGSLSPIKFDALTAGSQPGAILADPTGHYVYVLDHNAATIWQFALEAGGGLQPLSPAVVVSSVPPGSVADVTAVDPSGRFVYVIFTTNHELSAAQYAIGADGTLRALAPAILNLGSFDYYSTAVGSPPSACCNQPPSPWPHSDSLSFDPSRRYAFLEATSADGVTHLIRLQVRDDGTLSSSVQAAPAAGTFVLWPNGQNAYVLSGEGLATFSLDMSGNLTLTGQLYPGFRPSVPTDLLFALQSAYVPTYFTDTPEGVGVLSTNTS
jgi:DNA-binding beta-propeller fold protein YncE